MSELKIKPIYRHGILKCNICDKILAWCGCCNTVHLSICDRCLEMKVNTIIDTPDEEILKDAEDKYGNPNHEANEVRKIINKAWEKSQKDKR